MEDKVKLLEELGPSLRLVARAQERFYMFLPNPRTPERHFFQADGFLPSFLRSKIKKYERHKLERATGL